MFIDTYHSRIGFAPNALTLCGQPVSVIEWETTSHQNDEDLWAKLTTLQNHTQPSLTHDGFCGLLQDVETLILRRIIIHTNTCILDVLPYGDKTITLTLPNGEAYTCHATPRFEAGVSQTVQVLRTALFFLTCQTVGDAAKKLAKMQLLGMATKALP